MLFLRHRLLLLRVSSHVALGIFTSPSEGVSRGSRTGEGGKEGGGWGRVCTGDL